MSLVAKHFDALTMCPYGGPEMVCHCLLVETKGGLVLVDSGLFARADFERSLRTPGYFLTLMRLSRDPELTAAHGIEKLGYDPKDVTHVVCTHLDLDHAGGITDFPDAEIHVTKAEREAAESPRTLNERNRYIPRHFTGARWKTREESGEKWNGFDCVRALSDDDPDVLLVPLPGHTRGHAAVAVRTATGWLLHCGDAYFDADEMTEKARATWPLEMFQRTVAIDNAMRKQNQQRLRDLKAAHSDIEVFCAHSKIELDRLRGNS